MYSAATKAPPKEFAVLIPDAARRTRLIVALFLLVAAASATAQVPEGRWRDADGNPLPFETDALTGTPRNMPTLEVTVENVDVHRQPVWCTFGGDLRAHRGDRAP